MENVFKVTITSSVNFSPSAIEEALRRAFPTSADEVAVEVIQSLKYSWHCSCGKWHEQKDFICPNERK
jgi:hypothetical protein